MIKPPIIFKTYSSKPFPWIKSIINIRGHKVSLSSAFWQLTHFLLRMWCHHPVTKGMAWPRSKWPEDRRCARGLDKLSLNCFDTEVWRDIFKRHSDCGVNAAGGLTWLSWPHGWPQQTPNLQLRVWWVLTPVFPLRGYCCFFLTWGEELATK